MPPGRKPRTAVEKLRARLWYEAVARALARKPGIDAGPEAQVTPYRIHQVLQQKKLRSSTSARQWRNYRDGCSSPSESVLRLIERFLPGTRRVYDLGPGYSFLWEALGPEPQRVLWQTREEWQGGVPVEHCFRFMRGATSGRTGIQDLIVPRSLAHRMILAHGVSAHRSGMQPAERGDISERLGWESLQECCGTLVGEDSPLRGYWAAWQMSTAPEVTTGIGERRQSCPEILLPFYAGLALEIARARVDGREEIELPPWTIPAHDPGEATPEEQALRLEQALQADPLRKLLAQIEEIVPVRFRIGIRIVLWSTSESAGQGAGGECSGE